MMQCGCALTRSSGAFSSWRDVQALEADIENDPRWEEIPVQRPFANVGEDERWFRCKECGHIWRLVYPDAPFRGVWERVDER